MENDSVLIQDVDLSLCRDGSVDFARGDASHHLVESNPLAGVLTTLALVEVKSGL